MLEKLKRAVNQGLRYMGAPVLSAARASERKKYKLSAPTTRTAFLNLVPTTDVLEIGPFDNPSLHGPDVAYFEVLDVEELRQRAREHKRNPNAVPEIDYVSPTGDLGIVDRHFSAVLSSHAIEHQPDLIRHLREVEALLQPGGRYYILAPDKRFSFDHFLPESTVEDVLAAYGRRTHSAQAISDHFMMTTHNRRIMHWLGVHGKRGPNQSAQRRTQEALRAAEAGRYVDVHAWIFTPESFHELITALHKLGKTRLEIEVLHDTGFPELEFFAVLRSPLQH